MASPVNQNNKLSIIELSASFGLGMVASIFTSTHPLIGGGFLAIVRIIEKIVEPYFQGLLKNIVAAIGAFFIINTVTKISILSAIFINIFDLILCFGIATTLFGITIIESGKVISQIFSKNQNTSSTV